MAKGMGGAMDLVHGAKRVIATMEHVTKDGSLKIVNECSLSVAGRGVIQRTITDLAVIDVSQSGLVLGEVASGTTVADVQAATEPSLSVPRHPRVPRDTERWLSVPRHPRVMLAG